MGIILGWMMHQALVWSHMIMGLHPFSAMGMTPTMQDIWDNCNMLES
jgi:hypothetical protein